MTRSLVLAYAGCALIWGTTWYAIRVCIAGYPTFAAVAMRFALASLVLVPIALRFRPWPRGRAWGWLVLAGVLDAAAYALVYLGEERVSGAIAAVLYGTQPLILALLLTVTRIEPITRRNVIGALISLGGVGVLFVDQLHISTQQAIGVAMVIGSVVMATSYSMVMKQKVGDVHRVVSTAIFLATTAVVLGIAMAIANEPLPWPPPTSPTVALVYLALVGTVAAFLLFFFLLGRTGLVTTSTLVFVFPLVAIVTDALFERELPLHARTYLGAAVVLGGLAITLRRT